MKKLLAIFLLLFSIGATAAQSVNVSVVAFGADPTGVTDSTTSINAAITSICNLGSPGVVNFPAGTFTVSSTTDAIKINCNNITLNGAGKFATTIINKSTSTASIIDAYNGTYPGGLTPISGIEIMNLGIDGNQANISHNANDTYENGIQIQYCQNCSVHDNFVRNVVFQGIIAQGSGDGLSKNNKIYSNIVTGFGEYGIGLEGGMFDSTINNNNVYSGITVAQVPGGSVGVLVSAYTQLGTGNIVQGNTINGAPSDCVRVQDASAYSSVIDNTISNCGTTSGSGIKTNAQVTSSNHLTISNNTLTAASDSGGAAITILSTSNSVGFIQVAGNKIQNTAGGGILVNAGKNISVVGNKITNCGTGAGTITSGIRLAGSTVAPFVSSNSIDTCAGNGIEVLSGTTSAAISGNSLVGNGTAYSDAGTGTMFNSANVSAGYFNSGVFYIGSGNSSTAATQIEVDANEFQLYGNYFYNGSNSVYSATNYAGNFNFSKLNGIWTVSTYPSNTAGTTLPAASASIALGQTGFGITGTLSATGHASESTANTPSITSGACGATTNGTIAGTDQNGKITIGASATTACAVTFGSSTWASSPAACVFSAATAASAAVTVLPYVSAISTSGFTLSGSVLATTAWYYHCQ